MRAARVAVVLATTVFLAGCFATQEDLERPEASGALHTSTQTSPAPKATAEVGDREDFLDEYRTASDRLSSSLPCGERFAAQPSGEWASDGEYEAGAGGMQAAFNWQCAWLVAYELAITNDEPSEAAVALDSLESWPDLPEVDPYIDSASESLWAETFIASARAGDPTGLFELAEGC